MRVLFLTVLMFLCASTPARAATHAGQPAPALTVTQFDGKSFDLAAQKGHVVIVNFWAGWCPPCQQELPVLGAFYRHFRARGLVVTALSLDNAHERQSNEMLLRDNFLPGGMLAEAQANDFGDPDSLPLTYIIDAKGVIRAIARKPVTEEDLNRLVLPLLGITKESRPVQPL